MALVFCDCSVDYDDGDRCSVRCSTIRKARKTHRCVECGDTILPGHRYENSHVLYDGTWETYHTCIPCKTLRDQHCPGGFYWGELADHLEWCFGFDYRKVPT